MPTRSVGAALYLVCPSWLELFVMLFLVVLHSWAVPSLGVKCDAVPGGLDQTPVFIKEGGGYSMGSAAMYAVSICRVPSAQLGVVVAGRDTALQPASLGLQKHLFDASPVQELERIPDPHLCPARHTLLDDPARHPIVGTFLHIATSTGE